MKKALATIAAIAIAATITGTAKAATVMPDTSGIYPMTAVVASLDYSKDIVTLENSGGYLWEFNGCEDWAVGDIASVIMWDNGTETLFDDVILSVRYSGFTF